MLGPRSRSEIDFLEKKVRKSREHRDPPLFTKLRDITPDAKQGGGNVFATFFEIFVQKIDF